MNLLTFAHYGEAQHFLKSGNFKQIDFESKNLFKNDNSFLLVTGEGLDATSKRLNAFFNNTNEKISKLINIGIGGALKDNLDLGSICRIKKILQENESETLLSADVYSNINCISAINRIDNKSYRTKLSKLADVVDQELWACAKECSIRGIPVYSFKLISDYANNPVDFKTIVRNAKEYSRKLYEYFVTNF